MSTLPVIHPEINNGSFRDYGGLFYGVYPALVSDVVDPEGQGRVQVKLPWSPDGDGDGYQAWARLATLMAGNERGSWFIPDVNDEVLVVFEAGDPRHPYVIGVLWNGVDDPPQSMDEEGDNNIKTIRTRSGVQITWDDTDGKPALKLETPDGQKVILGDDPEKIAVQDSNGNQVTMDSKGVSVKATSKVKITASHVDIAAGLVNVDASMTQCSGVLKADSVITNSVVSSSYTPGAGNIW